MYLAGNYCYQTNAMAHGGGGDVAELVFVAYQRSRPWLSNIGHPIAVLIFLPLIFLRRNKRLRYILFQPRLSFASSIL